MSVSARESRRSGRLFDEYDEYGLDSMQPSDEWGNDKEDGDDDDVDRYSVPEDEFQTDNEETSYYGTGSVFSKQSSFVDYVSNLGHTFSVEGSKLADLTRSFSTATFSKLDSMKQSPHAKAKAERSDSSHSRFVIENTEYMDMDRRDEQLYRDGGQDEEDDARDESTMSCSVEEHSQISELTMDIPTLMTEPKFAQCSALPTISEVKQFHSPQIAATCAAGVLEGKARCAAAADTTTNKIEENSDMLDFVFELVEDALCKPMKTSKADRKKVFMEAFHEESEKVFKMAHKNSYRESSRHSRSSTGTKRTGSRQRSSSRSSRSSRNSLLHSSRSSPVPMDEAESPLDEEEAPMDEVEAPMDEREASVRERSIRSTRRSDHSRMKIVDKPPLLDPPNHPTGYRKASQQDEDLTMDWSKMMSLAEKQLQEAEGRMVVSKDSTVSEVSKMTEDSSDYQSIRRDAREKTSKAVCEEIPAKTKPSLFGPKADILLDRRTSTSPTPFSVNTSNSTHATLPEDVVKELRELSALDSSSFEEEESRFRLTSALFRFVRSKLPKLPTFTKTDEKREEGLEMTFDEISVASSIPILESMDEQEALTRKDEELEREEMAYKIITCIAFFYAFVFWPEGVKRKHVPKQPPRMPASLLQLVNKK